MVMITIVMIIGFLRALDVDTILSDTCFKDGAYVYVYEYICEHVYIYIICTLYTYIYINIYIHFTSLPRSLGI